MLNNKDTLNWLCNNANLIPEYGRWDDLVYLTYESRGTEFEEIGLMIIGNRLWDDYKLINTSQVSLLAKWMPSENASSVTTRNMAKYFISKFNCSPKNYRKVLSTIRKYLRIVETNLTKKDYKSIDYSIVPSKANLKYSKAFLRNDYDRYTEYISKVNKGEAKINASTLYPY